MKKFVKFLCGGVISYGIKLILTLLLTEVLHLWYLLSYSITMLIIVLFGFFYNFYFVFENIKHKKRKFIIYTLSLLSFTAIDIYFVKILTENLRVYYLFSIIISTTIFVTLKFLFYKRFVFIDYDQTQINGIVSPLLQIIRIKNAKPFFKGKSFLDIGCSLGEIIPHLPKKSRYVGIEGNKRYFTNAKKNYPKHKFLNIYLNKNNVNKLKIKERFDTIIALAVIEHMDDPKAVLKGLKRYLKKDGRIVISTPAKHSEIILRIGSKLGIFTSEINEHKQQFAKKKLIKIAKVAGYNVIHYHKFEFGMNHLIVLSLEQKS